MTNKAYGMFTTGTQLLANLSSSQKKNKQKHTGKPRSAKTNLRRAYERKAKSFVRRGLLGQARRTLRKKATVV